ncbi:MOB kinase activator 2-like isoform X2 [Amphiura filiformis]|uniref:MOB kinase activator 2-like isoform X2 n=1 Tax=Amphiura filiformis TaxID=82378 RepID=UPI003B225315
MDWLMGIGGRGRDRNKPSPVTEEPKPYLEEKYTKANSIIEYDIRDVVRLPSDMDFNEWFGTNLLSFFSNVNLLYGVLSGEYCTNETCPNMLGPGGVQYYWHDEKGKKTKCSAPLYIDYVMTYAQRTMNDESTFPSKYGNVFPSDFEAIMQRILRLLFNVVAHIYHAHFMQLVQLDLHLHLNCVFSHIVIFCKENKTLEITKEVNPLEDLIDALQLNSRPSGSNSASS